MGVIVSFVVCRSKVCAKVHPYWQQWNHKSSVLLTSCVRNKWAVMLKVYQLLDIIWQFGWEYPFDEFPEGIVSLHQTRWDSTGRLSTTRSQRPYQSIKPPCPTPDVAITTTDNKRHQIDTFFLFKVLRLIIFRSINWINSIILKCWNVKTLALCVS